jgi:hypothetical protein
MSRRPQPMLNGWHSDLCGFGEGAVLQVGIRLIWIEGFCPRTWTLKRFFGRLVMAEPLLAA